MRDLDGIRQLRSARDHLGDDAGDARSRLRLAARDFWWATFDAAAWPADLRRDAAAIQDELVGGGLIHRAVDSMDEATVEEVSVALLAFCRSAERFADPEPPAVAHRSSWRDPNPAG